jgi:hypothetical protein
MTNPDAPRCVECNTPNSLPAPNRIAKSSRFKGVSWDAQRGSCQAKVGINGKTTHLGRFADEEDAARAYDAAAVAAFGAYARTNFTTGDS